MGYSLGTSTPSQAATWESLEDVPLREKGRSRGDRRCRCHFCRVRSAASRTGTHRSSLGFCRAGGRGEGVYLERRASVFARCDLGAGCS